MSDSSKALPTGSLVLVTGINGYISSHIADQLLNLGYHVRGTARSSDKLDPILATLRRRNPNAKAEGLIVKDMADEDSLHQAAEGVAGIIHVASDVSFNPDPNDVVPLVVKGTRNALQAAATTSSVKRFVLTSSSIAAVHPTPNVEIHVDTNSWNEEDVKAAWAPPPYEPERAFSVYAASKVAGERAAWDFASTAKPGFVLNTVLPNFTVGKILDPSQPGSTAGWVARLFNNDEFQPGHLKSFPPMHHIEVVDAALLHVAALLETDVANERLMAFAQPYNYTSLVETLKGMNSDWTGYPEPDNNEGKDLSIVANGRAKALLRRYGRSDFKTLKEALEEQFAA